MSPLSNEQEARAALRQKQRRNREAVRNFAEAVRTANGELLVKAIDVIDQQYVWPAAMRAVSKTSCRSTDFRRRLLRLWLSSGDHIRDETGNDLVITKALIAMLPRYKGRAIKLYRGETFSKHKRRTYGIAWTASVVVARHFASEQLRRAAMGGSVLIETLAPPEAIICAPALIDASYGEREYLIDRRQLRSVTVVEQFAQCSPFGEPIT